MSGTKILALADDGQSFNLNVQIPKTGGGFWANLCDIYVPSSYQTSMTMLHGGGGNKLQMAVDMHVVVAPGNHQFLVNWQLLSTWKCIAVFPQGQYCDGTVNAWNPFGRNTVSSRFPTGIPYWDCHDGYSQNDDTSFLQDLSNYLSNTYGISNNGKTLLGHSAGGIMVKKMWRESPLTFSTYATLNGPPASYYNSNPVTPSVIRPIFNIQSYLDTTIAAYNAYVNGVYTPGSIYQSSLYWQDPSNITQANVAWPGQGIRIGSWVDFQQQQTFNGDTPVSFGSGVSTPISVGNKIVWTNPNGKIILWELDSADHSMTSCQAALGNGLFSQVALFAAST